MQQRGTGRKPRQDRGLVVGTALETPDGALEVGETVGESASRLVTTIGALLKVAESAGVRRERVDGPLIPFA